MTLNRQDGLAVQVGVANRGHELVGAFLAWTATLSFCGGLFGLAVSPAFEVAVPRWFILAHGGCCALLALLAPLLSRPWQSPTSTRQDHGLPMGEDPRVFWAAAAKASTAHYSRIDPKRAAVRPADRASIVAP